jgi:hypothetical protein
MSRSIAAALLGLMAACAPSHRGVPSACLQYEPATVILSGRLMTVQEYGPPNFGETPDKDERISVPLLALTRPIDVCGDSASELNSETERGVRELQLLGVKQSEGEYDNRSVRIVGRLSHAQTGYHFTKVLLSVERVDAE